MHLGHRLRLLPLPSILALATALAAGQQPNSSGASAVLGGAAGPPWPVVLVLNRNTASFDIGGMPGQPYLVARAPSGLRASGEPTPAGLLDLDPGGGFVIVIDGISCPCAGMNAFANTGPTGIHAWTIPFAHAPPQEYGAFQALVADPSAPSGFRLSAATRLSTVAAPGAIHVSATLGAPGNAGTAASPLSTISAGVAASLAAGVPHPPVYVHAGTYVESPVFAGGVSVHGGCDPGTWLPAPGLTSVVETGTTPALATGITVPTAVTGLDVRAGDASGPSASSLALRVVSCSDRLVFYRCRFQAGRGGDGTAGAPGLPGTAGADGNYGCWWSYASCGATWWSAALWGQGGAGDRPGGAGGDGGQIFSIWFWNGGAGGAAPFGGGAGGAGGIYYWNGNGTSTPADGQPGADGPDGAAGTPGSALGGIFAGQWMPAEAATAGTPGGPGLGGGGGGGSGAVSGAGVPPPNPTMNGHGGGGGGAGGGGGEGGAGGGHGGASIAASLVASSPAFLECVLVSGAGGNGGAGGAGGPGGAGGQGGHPYVSPVPHGAWGGQGGAGGDGGGGGGGPGGPSFALLPAAGSAPGYLATSTLLPGTGGTGGAGGLHGNGVQQAPGGAAGPSSPVGP